MIEAMMAEVEDEVVAAGASPASVEVRLEEEPERSTVARRRHRRDRAQRPARCPGRSELGQADVAARPTPAHRCSGAAATG